MSRKTISMISEPGEDREPRRTAKYVLEEIEAYFADLELTLLYKQGEEEMTPELKERAEKALAGLRAGLEELNAIIASLEGTEKPKGKLDPEIKKKLKEAGIGHPEIKKDEEEAKGAIKVEDVTIEMLREKATEYSKVFGMEKLLTLNSKHGGAKKLSGIDPKMYGVVYGAMTDDLAAAQKIHDAGIPDHKPASKEEIKSKAETLKEEIKSKAETLKEEIKPVTIEKVREHAAAFLNKNGEPALKAVLKAFNAEKISQIPAERYPAFLEAIDNA